MSPRRSAVSRKPHPCSVTNQPCGSHGSSMQPAAICTPLRSIGQPLIQQTIVHSNARSPATCSIAPALSAADPDVSPERGYRVTGSVPHGCRSLSTRVEGSFLDRGQQTLEGPLQHPVDHGAGQPPQRATLWHISVVECDCRPVILGFEGEPGLCLLERDKSGW